MKRIISLLPVMILSTAMLLSGCGEKAEDSDQNSEGDPSTFCVYLTDEDGNGLEGGVIQLCDDTSCRTGETDTDGCVDFKVEPGDYTIHVLEAPEGYYNDEEYTVTSDDTELTIIAKEETGDEEVSEDDSSESDSEEADVSDDELEALLSSKCPDYKKEISSNYDTLSFSTVDVNGEAFTSDDIKGYNVVLFNFFESWCNPCMGEIPELESIYEDYKDKGVLVVGVYCDPEYTKVDTGLPTSDRDDIMQMIEDDNVTYPVIAYTGDFDAICSTEGRPSSIFTDGDGNVYAATKEEYMYLFDDEEAVDSVMETEPEGCILGAFGEAFRVFINDRLD